MIARTSIFRTVVLLAFLLTSAVVHAEKLASCTPLFAGRHAPTFLNTKLAERTHALCHRAYAVLDSGLTRGPLWSAEHPTTAGLAAARGTLRVDLFHSDDCLSCRLKPMLSAGTTYPSSGIG